MRPLCLDEPVGRGDTAGVVGDDGRDLPLLLRGNCAADGGDDGLDLPLLLGGDCAAAGGCVGLDLALLFLLLLVL